LTADNTTHPYDSLTPDVILDAVETYGVHCTGELLPLNSYENRVYRVGTEEQGPVAVKFYRPGRWSDDAILEEHAFTLMLEQHEIPVVAPVRDADGRSLNRFSGFRFSLFPWQPGRVPELNRPEDFAIVGRYLGRLHALGKTEPFQHRPTLTIEAYGIDAVAYIREHDFMPAHLETAYDSLTAQLLGMISDRFAATRIANIRLHGDCHLSNLLWTDTGPHIVDFDDCRMGPAVQDLWMLLAGEREEQEQQLANVLVGYTQFCDFSTAQLGLIESLRTLRMLHYSAWLAQRWDDPAFPFAFPWFNTTRYWEEHILSLREQQAALAEPPLEFHRELAG
jgi:Ser/Thr protein kinase RdoA (MazF antagonist)